MGILSIYALIGIVHAQMKLEITPSDNKYASMSIDCEDQAKCDKKLLKWIDKQRFFSGEWLADSTDTIVSKAETDLEGNESTKHFKPSNFSVNLVDISAEITEQEAKRLAKQVLKDKLNIKKKDLTLKEINELLRD